MIKIIPVETKKDLQRFIKLPFRLYKNDPNWIPPLIMDMKTKFNPQKNPYYEHSQVQPFLAERNGKIIGRITAQTNTQHNKAHNDKVGFFGFFESIDDQKVPDKLFETAYNWLQKKDCDTMRGPMNLSVNDECGLLIDGFDSPPYVLMTHNKKYYVNLIEKSGLSKKMDLYAYKVPVTKAPERIEKLAKKLEKRGKFTIRSLSTRKAQLKEDIKTTFEIYTKAWENNWGDVPMTKSEFDNIVKEMLIYVRPEFVYIAEVDGKPAGFSLTLPDYNFVLKKMNGYLFPIGIFKALYYKNKVTRLRVIAMGVIKEYKNRGIDIAFYAKSFETANNHRIKWTEAEFSWILENNKIMNRIAKNLGGVIHKTYRIYDKKIAY
ncbi:MAG: GNAT family N-acetyltransferase [Candidatus Cloacimonetes bacterium]|nr:GNAT family N-acetyltransferase [Candidatus Cloacimonadota bacterium]